MQFKKFKLSAIYTAIFMQLSVSTLGMPVVAHASTQQDNPASNPEQRFETNDKTTDARQFGQNQLNSMAGQQAESWLNGFGGSSRVSISSDKNFSNYNYAGDVLVPLWDSRDFMVFSQLGARHADERTTGNIGFGSRYFVDGWMLGNNVFFDNDFSGNNRRIGIGAELWTEALRLAANGYYGLNSWHASKLLADYDERPANGWDIELASWLPMYPQLGGKVKYEQYYGDNVALMSRSNRQKNPSAVALGANWTPVPLVTVDAGHRKSMQSGGDTTLGLNLNWNFGRSLDWHLSPEAVADQRSLVGSRYELVSRNNQIVMDYREQTVITFSLASAIKGVEGTSQPLGVSVWAKYGLDKIVWDDAALVAAGGKVTGTGTNSALVLPAYKEGANNSYTLSAVAYDGKGKASPRAQVQITVEKAEQVIPDEPGTPEQPQQPGQPDAGQSTATLTQGELIADGISQTEMVVELKDKDGKAISGAAGNLRLEATIQNALSRNGNGGVSIGKFSEYGDKSGSYLVDVTAGTEAGVVTLSLYHGNTLLKQQPLTLVGKGDEVNAPAAIQILNQEKKFVAGTEVTFTAQVTDSQGKAMKDVTVEFTDVNLNVTDTVQTDAQGHVTKTISMPEKASDVFNWIGARVADNQKVMTQRFYTVKADVASARVVQGQSTDGTLRNNGLEAEMVTPATFTIALQDRFQNPIIQEIVSVVAERRSEQNPPVTIKLNNYDHTNPHGEVTGEGVVTERLNSANAYYDLYVVVEGKRIDGPSTSMQMRIVN